MSVSRIVLCTMIWVTGLLACTLAHALTDISVEFGADPSSGLIPDQPIEFTLAVTNHGPLPVDDYNLAIRSSDIYDQFDPSSGSTDCFGYTVIITDGDGFSYATISWSPTILGQGALEIGETRICHFTLALSNQAPAAWPFSFGVADFFDDINPDNNESTVILRRGDIAPVELPALSPYTFILLITAITSMAWLAIRRRRGADDECDQVFVGR